MPDPENQIQPIQQPDQPILATGQAVPAESPTPLFDMSKAQPIQTAQSAQPDQPAESATPLFDMSKAQPIQSAASAKPPSFWEKVKEKAIEPLLSEKTPLNLQAPEPYLVAQSMYIPAHLGELAAKALKTSGHPTLGKIADAYTGMAKGSADFVSGMSSPLNIGIMVASEGFGEIPGALGAVASKFGVPAATLAKYGSALSKVVSLGFSIQGFKQIYNSIPEVKAAYDAGDTEKLFELLTGGAATAAISTLAARHATSGAGEFARTRGQAAKEVISDIKAAIGPKPADAMADLKKAIPSTASRPISDEDYKVVRPLLEQHHADIEPIETVKDAGEAAEYQRQNIENDVRAKLKKIENEPILGNVKQSVVAALKPQEAVKAGVLDAGLKALEPYNLTDPTIAEADAIRKKLNSENRAVLKKNFWDILTALDTDPEFAARYYAQDALRDGIYDRGEAEGYKGLREKRQTEASLINFRNAADRQAFNAERIRRGTGQAGPIAKLAAKGATYVGGMAGASIGGAVGGTLGAEGGVALGIAAGKKAGEFLAPGDISSNALVKRSFEQKVAEGAPAEPTAVAPAVPAAPAVAPPVNSELHGELATHYNQIAGRVPYDELEGRFMAQIEAKAELGVPLDKAEKELLRKVNAERLKPPPEVKPPKESEAAQPSEEIAAPAAPAAIPAEATHVYNSETKNIEPIEKPAAEDLTKMEAKAPFETTSEELPIPRRLADPDMTGSRTRAHEASHHIIANALSFKSIDTISHLHPEAKSGVLAEARWDDAPFRNEHGRVDLEKVKLRARDLIALMFGGPVGEEVHHGISVEENSGAGGDLRRIRDISKVAGFSPEETKQVYEEEKTRVKNFLTTPKIKDIVGKYTQEREAGIPDSHHMTGGTLQKMLQEIGDTNVNISGQVRGRGDGGVQQAHAGTEGQVGEGARAAQPEAAAKEVATAQERVPYREEAKIPSEISTGNLAYDAAIKSGGGIPGGIIKFGPGFDIVTFHDPTTGTSLGIREGKEAITPQVVREKLRTSREVYLKAKPEESRIPERGQAGYVEPEPTKMEATAVIGEEKTKPISDKLVEKYGTTNSSLKAGFILNDGRMVPLAQEHNIMLKAVGEPSEVATGREDFINNEKAIRTRFRTGRGGDELVFSVPKSGVSEEQISQMRQSIGKMDRHGNVVMEVAEPGGKSTTKEFALPSHVDGMLQEIGVHPEGLTKMEAAAPKDWADKAEQAAKEQGGGFTVDPRTGKAPTSGYMVEAHTEGRKVLDHPATAEDIRAFHDEHKDLFDKHPELHVGGFENELDISANVANRAAAEAVARKLDQRSIWDVKKGEEIPTGGEGKQTQFSGYPLEQRLAELKGENKFSMIAKSLADSIGAKVVGSVTKLGAAPHDIDLRIEGDYDKEVTTAKMKQAGFEPSGSSVMSPEEVTKYRKYVGGIGWKRMEHFEDATGRKVDVWHDEPESKKISPGMRMLAGK